MSNGAFIGHLFDAAEDRNDIRIRVKLFDLLFQLFRVPDIIRIEKGEHLPLCVLDANVPRPGRPYIFGELYQMQIALLFDHGLDNVRRIIGRRVIDYDDFRARNGLQIDTVDSASNKLGAVTNRYYRRYSQALRHSNALYVSRNT